VLVVPKNTTLRNVVLLKIHITFTDVDCLFLVFVLFSFLLILYYNLLQQDDLLLSVSLVA